MNPAHQRLEELMRSRRFALGIRTWRALAEKAGVSYETLRAVRAGGNPGEATADGLERALQWTPGSIAAILAGGGPTEEESSPKQGTRTSTDPDEIRIRELSSFSDAEKEMLIALLRARRAGEQNETGT